MRRSAFSDAEIIDFVRELEAGRPPAEVALVAGVSDRTLYRWRQRFAGLKPFAVRALRELEQENRRLRSEMDRKPATQGGPSDRETGTAPLRSDVGDGRGRSAGLTPSPPTVLGRFAALRLR